MIHSLVGTYEAAVDEANITDDESAVDDANTIEEVVEEEVEEQAANAYGTASYDTAASDDGLAQAEAELEDAEEELEEAEEELEEAEEDVEEAMEGEFSSIKYFNRISPIDVMILILFEKPQKWKPKCKKKLHKAMP